MIIQILTALVLFVIFSFLAFHINDKIIETEGKGRAGKTSLLTLAGVLLALVIPAILDYLFYTKTTLPALLYALITPIILYYFKAWRILFGFLLTYIVYLFLVGGCFILFTFGR